MLKAHWLSRCLPLVAYFLFLGVNEVLARFAWFGFDPRWVYALKIGVVLALSLWFWRRYVELCPIVAGEQWRLHHWAVAVFAGVAVFVLWINLNADWMVIGSSTSFDPRTNGHIDWWLVGIRLFGATLVVPVMEDLFWRSFLMRWLKRSDFLQVIPSQVGWFAFMATAVLFAFEHHFWFAGLVAGVVYNGLYMRSGNLWLVIVSHAVTNGLLGLWILYTGNWMYW